MTTKADIETLVSKAYWPLAKRREFLRILRNRIWKPEELELLRKMWTTCMNGNLAELDRIIARELRTTLPMDPMMMPGERRQATAAKIQPDVRKKASKKGIDITAAEALVYIVVYLQQTEGAG